MLNIYYGDMEDAVYNTSVYFDNTYLDKWLDDDLSKRIIKAVDKGDVVGPQCVVTKALGAIPPERLSGGTKTLLLMRNAQDRVYNASTCGDNCARWILRIAKESESDLTINLHHFMRFPGKAFEIKVLNNGVVAHNADELVRASIGLL